MNVGEGSRAAEVSRAGGRIGRSGVAWRGGLKQRLADGELATAFDRRVVAAGDTEGLFDVVGDLLCNSGEGAGKENG